MGIDDFLVFGLLIAISFNVSLSYKTSPIFERPTQSFIALFLSSAIIFVSIQIVIPKSMFTSKTLNGVSSTTLRRRTSIPNSRESSPKPTNPPVTPNSNLRRLSFVAAALVLCLRIEIFRLSLGVRQCLLSGIEGYIPLLLAIYNCWYNKRRDSVDSQFSSKPSLRSFIARFIYGEVRYIWTAAILSGVIAAGPSLIDIPRSTTICPVHSNIALTTRGLQLFGLVLDCYLIIGAVNMLGFSNADAVAEKEKRPLVVASFLTFSAFLLSIGGMVHFFTHPGQWKWILDVGWNYIRIILSWSWKISLGLACILKLIAEMGLLDLVMTFGYTHTYISLLVFDRVKVDAFRFTSESINSSTAIKILCIGILWYFYTASSLSTTKANKPTLRRLLRTLGPASFLLLSLVLNSRFRTDLQRPSLSSHPIDLLIIEAEDRHTTWLDKASASKTLQECVEEYHKRYKRRPPPGFDMWYRYATERSSVVIDDYDNMMGDLLPFWALKPAEIRKATSDILSDSWNEVAEITIRSGKPEIGPDVKPTHRWMLDGVIAMLSNFKDKLPDMDLAFNINDEPRVAIPYDKLESLRKDAKNKDTVGKTVLDQFTGNRSNGWQRANHQDPNLSSFGSHPFEDHSFLPSFHNFGSISCPPTSHARTTYLWDSRDLCHRCFAPHSQGLFLSNWTLSASPCHQPDLAHLHGFYLSPAAFKPSKRLVPVFSQSKAQGYADILYPSPWNYKDKVKYDPTNATGPYPDLSFVKKENALFWRGATSEGLSRWGTWKSMMRQRFVHTMNDIPKNAKIPILLPDPRNEGNFAYQNIPHLLFQQLGLKSSVSFVSSIARCWDSDCPDQKAEFALPGPTDFQAHWGYRYLMDLDGAGFSGRFIPFLQSRSLPFKAALFREWWEGRVTAWKHFVPVDLRLWGLWSTLAYFEGTNNVLNEEGRWTLRGMEEKTDVGGKMAREGREWADKVLRKEDMEVYLYRLLLEWARLTDDRRDEIGFMG